MRASQRSSVATLAIAWRFTTSRAVPMSPCDRKPARLMVPATKDRTTPIEYIAEAVYQLSIGDPKTMTGRIDHAAPFLQEFKIKPSELV